MNDEALVKRLMNMRRKSDSPLALDHGSRVAVIGGGPSGSLFSYFLLDMAERTGLKINVDIYEPRDFDLPAPCGLQHVRGVIYESLFKA
jgi:hypothetical protein